MHRYTVVNAFGQERFAGNPVAVFFACDDLDDGDVQRLAAELNLSETTFIRAPRNGRDGRRQDLHSRQRAGLRGSSAARHRRGSGGKVRGLTE